MGTEPVTLLVQFDDATICSLLNIVKTGRAVSKSTSMARVNAALDEIAQTCLLVDQILAVRWQAFLAEEPTVAVVDNKTLQKFSGFDLRWRHRTDQDNQHYDIDEHAGPTKTVTACCNEWISQAMERLMHRSKTRGTCSVYGTPKLYLRREGTTINVNMHVSFYEVY